MVQHLFLPLWISTCSRAICYRNNLFSTEMPFHLCLKSIVSIYMDLFLTLPVVPVIYLSIVTPAPHSWLLSLKSGSFSPSTLFFFFKAVLASLGSLHVFVTFRICLEISKNCWHFDWSCTESTDQFGENWHNKTETSIIALHLFRSSFSQQHFMVFQWRGFAHLLLDLPLSISYFWCYYK